MASGTSSNCTYRHPAAASSLSSVHQILEKAGAIGIGRRIDRLLEAEEMKGARCGHGDFHQGLAGIAARALVFGQRNRTSAHDRCRHHAGLPTKGLVARILELEMCRSEPEALDAFEEEAKPGAATELTVGHDLEADGLLARDDARHFACQHLLGLAARDRPAQVQGDGCP